MEIGQEVKPNLETARLSTYQTKFLVGLFSGGVAAMAGATVACPFDVIKTRLQSSHTYLTPCSKQKGGGTPLVTSFHVCKTPNSSSHFDFHRSLSIIGDSTCARVVTLQSPRPFLFHPNDSNLKIRQRSLKPSVIHVLRTSVKNEGFASLFKGLAPSLAAVVPSKSLYFGFYSIFKDFYTILFPFNSHANILCSSLTAGFIQASTISPLFMVRTRLQLSTSSVSVRECFQQIYHAHGVKGFFRGLSATYLGLSETAIYFLLYENIKYFLKKEKHLSNNIDAKNSALVGLSAIFSRVVATTCAYPHEVVRTRMRQVDANYSSLLDCFARVYRREGLGGLYRGLEVELLKKVPNVAAVFIVYESLMSYFANQWALKN